ncbi:MAG: ferrous iron transport protein A [Candidatus Methanoplasma sp.]|nr:ferrous iron transport protein A [Candidatus Methanoplasma sp.]
MNTLEGLGVGEEAVVARVTGDGKLRKRILDMGITKGCRIRKVKVAPLGDPIEVALRGYELSIRKEDAASVEIEPAEAEPAGEA